MKTPAKDALSCGDTLLVRAERMAHGGEAIAYADDGRVLFVRGAFPGDEVQVRITQVKKRFARAEVIEVRERGKYHGEQSCPAAAAGAGCCDFGAVVEEYELELKTEILRSQLSRVIDLDALPPIEAIDLPPHRRWRTRVRLGVGKDGRPGLKRAGSHEIVTAECTQLVDSLATGLIDTAPGTFEPGAEIIAVKDSQGTRHVVESLKSGRGQRVERVIRTIEGDGTAVESVGGVAFRMPPSAFWQAHVAAPEVYSEIITRWVGEARPSWPEEKQPVAWDLYGGVGLFAPALAKGIEASGGKEPAIYSVDYSPAANRFQQPGLENLNVTAVLGKVESEIAHLPRPQVVVLDPPRAGAGDKVVQATAWAQPELVIHIGCDPATFARDLASWKECGYGLKRLSILNAFPGTHHFEVIAALAGTV